MLDRPLVVEELRLNFEELEEENESEREKEEEKSAASPEK